MFDAVMIEKLIVRSNQGDEKARRELFELVYQRLQHVARKMLRNFPGVHRWEQTDDVWQNAGIKLWKSLSKVHINDSRHFYALAAMHLRRELIGLTRHYFGPLGLGTHQDSREYRADANREWPVAPEGQTDTHEGSHLAMWTEFHQHVEQLAENDREVFDLLWYQGLSQAEAAKLIDVSERTIKRRWQSARLELAANLKHQLPD